MMNSLFNIPPTARAETGQLLLQLADDILDVINKSLETYHISESKLTLLLLFFITSNEQQSLQPSEIAEKLDIRRASVTKQLKWLEREHLIIRTVNIKDQRMVDVTITTKGYQLLEQVMPHYWQTCTTLTNQLSEEEMLLLSSLLKKIHKHLSISTCE